MVEIQIDRGHMVTVTFVVDDLPVTNIKEYTIFADPSPERSKELDQFVEKYSGGREYTKQHNGSLTMAFEVKTVEARTLYESLTSLGYEPLDR